MPKFELVNRAGTAPWDPEVLPVMAEDIIYAWEACEDSLSRRDIALAVADGAFWRQVKEEPPKDLQFTAECRSVTHVPIRWESGMSRYCPLCEWISASNRWQKCLESEEARRFKLEKKLDNARGADYQRCETHDVLWKSGRCPQCAYLALYTADLRDFEARDERERKLKEHIKKQQEVLETAEGLRAREEAGRKAAEAELTAQCDHRMSFDYALCSESGPEIHVSCEKCFKKFAGKISAEGIPGLQAAEPKVAGYVVVGQNGGFHGEPAALPQGAWGSAWEAAVTEGVTSNSMKQWIVMRKADGYSARPIYLGAPEPVASASNHEESEGTRVE